MAKIAYKVTDFNYDAASQGALCAMVSIAVSSSDIVYSKNDENFKGAGICKLDNHNDVYFRVKSVTYKFKGSGEAKSDNATNWKLMMATVTNAFSDSAGSTVNTDITYETAATRGSGGKIEYDTTSTIGDATVFIDNLNARDQFATQALRGILSRIEEDPTTLSTNEMNYYCEAAYTWAANMMAAAAKVRATYDDQTGEEVPVDMLESTTDKLLNNILSALKRTDEEVIPSGTTDPIYYERISIPALMDFLNNYVKNGNSSVGLKDLIEAINNINEGGQASSISVTSIPSLGGTINIGSSGLGRDAAHPLYIKIVTDE